MRLLSLELEKYGAFTNRVLRFRPGARAHVVYGANETGKSTALAAVTDLLFGIGRDTTRDFLHRGPELRIRGEIASRNGKTLAFARRKGNKATLLDPDGATLPDDALAPFLGGLTREVFARAFGLDASALRLGAEDMLKSGGDAAESLMAAASGRHGLSNLRAQLEKEAADIFTPRAAKERTFYQAIDRFEVARKAIRERELRAGDWRKLQDDIAARAAKLVEIDARRKEISAHLARLSRLGRLKPRIAAIDMAMAGLAAREDNSGLPRGFGARLGEALAALEGARKSHEAASAASEAAARDLAAIKVDQPLIARGAEIADINRGLGAYEKALADRPRVQSETEGLRSRLLDLAGRLGVGDLEDLAARRPTDAAMAGARALISEGDDIERDLRALDAAIARENEAIAAQERQRAAQDALLDPAPLREKLAVFGDVALKARERDQERQRLALEASALAESAARLAPSALDFDALARAPLPGREAIAAFARAFNESDEETRDARKEAASARADAETASARMRELAGERPVPTPERIAAAREAREAEWRALRAALFGESGAPGGAALAGAAARHEVATSEADRLADEAARDADRVSRHRAAGEDLASHTARAAEAGRQLADIEARRRDLDEQWREAWRPAGTSPLPPGDMAGWLTSVDSLLDRRAALAERQNALARVEADLASAAAPLEALCAQAGLDPMPGLEAGRLIARIGERLKALDATWNDARDAQTRHDDAKARREDLLKSRDGLSERRDDWRTRWRVAMPALGLEGSAPLDGARAALEAWREAPGLIAEHNDRLRRVNGMTRDMEIFESRAASVVRDHAGDLAQAAAADAARDLQARLDLARREEVRHNEQTRRKAERDTALNAAAIALADAQGDLDALARLAPSRDDLDALRQRLDRRDAALEALDKARAEFLIASEGRDESAARDELSEFDPDQASAEKAAAAREDERLDAEAKLAFAEHRDLLKKDAEFTTAVGAEVAQQMKRGAEAEMRQLARDWAALKIGGLLLEAALERHRAKRKDPLLARASDLFGALTGGGFSAIEQQFDDADAARIMARRASGEPVGVEGLSEGARDQLYLALRFAYVEDYAARSEPAPFIADDLFASFDDARTGFALEALAQLGAQVQPILFTHHRHVVDIARTLLGGDVDIIELG